MAKKSMSKSASKGSSSKKVAGSKSPKMQYGGILSPRPKRSPSEKK
jgi:hypothetical protein